MTPQPSIGESAAAESTALSGASPIRLPSLLNDLEHPEGLPNQTDALSRWLMGSVPRATSAAFSETITRPGTVISEVTPVPREITTASSEQYKHPIKVPSFIEKKMQQGNLEFDVVLLHALLVY